MKKILLLIIILINAIVIDVYADSTTWPNTFTGGNYEYTIEGVSLYVYKMESEVKPDGDKTTKEEDKNNYLSQTPTREIQLSSTDYTIDPQYSKDTRDGVDFHLINLNLNLTKNKIKTLLTNEIANTTENINYMVEIVVKYHLNTYPNKYNYFYNINTLRQLLTLFSNTGTEGNTTQPSINPTTTVKQVINLIGVNYNDNNNSAEIIYENRANEENGITLYILNYLGLKETPYESEANDGEVFMIYNIENIGEVLNQIYSNSGSIINIEDDDEINDVEDIMPTTSNNTGNVPYNNSNPGKVISVPNTAKDDKKSIYAISMILIIIGISVIACITYKKNEN